MLQSIEVRNSVKSSLVHIGQDFCTEVRRRSKFRRHCHAHQSRAGTTNGDDDQQKLVLHQHDWEVGWTRERAGGLGRVQWKRAESRLPGEKMINTDMRLAVQASFAAPFTRAADGNMSGIVCGCPCAILHCRAFSVSNVAGWVQHAWMHPFQWLRLPWCLF